MPFTQTDEAEGLEGVFEEEEHSTQKYEELPEDVRQALQDEESN